MIKILTVFGTRPEAIKMAPVVRELSQDSGRFITGVCVTAQHRQMLDQVLDLFGITPQFDLNVMKPGQDLHGITTAILSGMCDVFRAFKPDLVMVHGDTTTSFAASLAAFYEGIPTGHVEAGLRTGNLQAPFPEEANRQMTARLTSLHFAPTQLNRQNLLNEGIPSDRIYVTGNTVIDALLWTRNQALAMETAELTAYCGLDARDLADGKPLILVTAHRRESFGEGFQRICSALQQIAANHPEATIVFPVHPNPNVRGPVTSALSHLKNIRLIEPLDYLPFVYLMNKSGVILTDSGGVQEEAPALGKHVLVMRDTTERPEAVEAGGVELVGTNTEVIVNAVEKALAEAQAAVVRPAFSPYGDGKAAQRIAATLVDYFS